MEVETYKYRDTKILIKRETPVISLFFLPHSQGCFKVIREFYGG